MVSRSLLCGGDAGWADARKWSCGRCRWQKITRTAKNPVKLRRAIVVLMSGQGQPAPDIAYLLKATEDYVRDVIHAFSEWGFDALEGAHRTRSVSRSATGSA
ncbi:hypothetical protein GCM10010168_20710 [Actinoplanes ianthinogenes]|uniref:Transposase n=1 Tax=Actinoplanes ianthinogenes TaxID=122358 RepID=A0ABM7M7V8_9ACTN|nr:hypothetical protein Aiant_83690 [Actinoplanes ianthinogenes]GGR03650.1 hypothetical protein GCM10010168_20710 [Actinoplanes ianthinogenes]